MVSKIRLIVQHAMFVVLTYGGRLGIDLGYALPCFSCPYVRGNGGGCYLMCLQGSWRGLQMSMDKWATSFGLDAIFYLALFFLLAIVLNKFWCGWICPFGTLQDWLTYLRRRLGIPESRYEWATRDRLKPVKWVLLAYLIIVPLLVAHAGLHPDFGLPFCQICPAKPLMPLFAGETRHLSLDLSNAVTLTFTVLSVTIAGGMLAGMFFKERFFCIFCPMLTLIHLVRKISPVRFEKYVDGCVGCGNCQRVCPVDIRDVHEKKSGSDALSEDCMLCLSCTESCPEDNVLRVKLFRWPLFSSSRKYVAGNFSKGKKRHE